jgi:murE/murF fusion protein
MQLAQLIDGCKTLRVRSNRADPGVSISDLTDDSRTVKPGSLFIARDGLQSDGRKYIDAAIAAGAVAVLSDRPIELPAGRDGQAIVQLVADKVDQSLAGHLAERFFGYPQQKLALLGVTGTNGKTTTAFLIQHLLNRSGVACGLIGTIQTDNGAEVAAATLTTPGAIELSRLLAAMVAHGCRAAVIEASSHALKQGRIAALDFQVGVFTNLSGDHLDYHATMADYLAAKAVLFESLSPDAWAVFNADDASSQQIAARCAARQLWCTLGHDEHGARTCRVEALELAAGFSRARFDGPWGSVEAKLPLIGRHNLANTLQALAAASAVTDVSRHLDEVLSQCPQVPGRLEMVRIEDDEQDPTVLVDYAHSHDALENVLTALRPLTKGRLRVMFGCGGDRDRTKRPKMAQVACRLADDIVITSDNPRTEDPGDILDDIRAGIDTKSDKRCRILPGRTHAIDHIVTSAELDDVVLLAGKGHEDYQIIGTEKRPFDDRKHATAALLKRRWSRSRRSGWTPRSVEQAVAGQWLIEPADQDTDLTWVSIDSRSIGPGEIFIALKGERFDGHDFVKAAIEAGAALVVVDRLDCIDPSALQGELAGMLPGALPGVLLVDDTLIALQELARAHRRVLGEAGTRVIAMTGSSGKTTTRALIWQVLSATGHGLQSCRSFNNHIGVPLTLLSASPADDFILVEVGTNHPGEVAALADIIRPDAALITNIGTAHIGFFGSRAAIAAEKGTLLRFIRPQGFAVVPADEPLLDESIAQVPSGVRVLRFTGDPADRAADVACTQIEPLHLRQPLRFTVRIAGQPRAVSLPLLGVHNIANAIAAIAVGYGLEVPASQTATALADASGVSMRMEVIKFQSGERRQDVIMDAYNANPDSMKCAIETLATARVDPIPGQNRRRRVAILGDMGELGDAGPDAHRAVGKQLAEHGSAIDLAIFIGNLSMLAADVLRESWPAQRVVAWPQWDDTLPDQIVDLLKPGDVILLKASRSGALERLLPAMAKAVKEGTQGRTPESARLTPDSGLWTLDSPLSPP